MKKLMIAAALAFAAVASQAATVSWTITSIKESGTAVNGTLFLIASTNYSRDDFLGLAGKGAEAFATALGTAKAAPSDGWAVTSGTGSMATSYANKPTNSDLGLSDATTYNFYAVIFDSDTISDTSKFFVTNELTSQKTAAGDSNKALYFGSMATQSAADGAWKSVGDVPEPTSAMLLLLGVAGLALRRRV